VDADDPADIWVYELERAVRTRITFDPGFDSTPVWSPDGTRIAYVNEASSRNSYRIMVTNASGIGEAEVLLEDPRDLTTSSWSRDGKFLLYHVTDPNTEDVWVLPMEGERKPFAFLTGPYFEREAVFSPDGKWVAYMSTESGLEEVYVTNFPERNRKWQVSIGEGDRPRWSADGKRIYYLSNSDMIMAVDLEVRGNELHIAPPKQVFQARPRRPGNVFQVSGDGKRFLVVDRGEITNSPVSLVLNWPASVTK
jgi:Tol biopolymer transport system component